MNQPKLYQKYDCYEQESSREYSISNWKEILTFHYHYKLEGSRQTVVLLWRHTIWENASGVQSSEEA